MDFFQSGQGLTVIKHCWYPYFFLPIAGPRYSPVWKCHPTSPSWPPHRTLPLVRVPRHGLQVPQSTPASSPGSQPTFVSRKSLHSLLPCASLTRGAFSKLHPLYIFSDEQIHARLGDDAILYLRFQRYLILFALIVTLLAMCVAFPINFFAGGALADFCFAEQSFFDLAVYCTICCCSICSVQSSEACVHSSIEASASFAPRLSSSNCSHRKGRSGEVWANNRL